MYLIYNKGGDWWTPRPNQHKKLKYMAIRYILVMNIKRIVIGDLHDDPVDSIIVNKWVTEFNKCAYKMSILLKWIESKSEKRTNEGKTGIQYRFEDVKCFWGEDV